ncbi:MAG: hypothetical protein N2C14_22875 [Planctomycetales bacterium]
MISARPWRRLFFPRLAVARKSSHDWVKVSFRSTLRGKTHAHPVVVTPKSET